jgi:hypothetical protein
MNRKPRRPRRQLRQSPRPSGGASTTCQNDLAPELIDACRDASRRIRLERQVAYERPVVLECDVGDLTLLPIAEAQTRLLLPFRLNKGMKTLTGELVLGDRDPLPLLIGEDVADEDALTAWAYALVGFADTTCVEFEPTEPRTGRGPTRPRQPPSLTSHRRPSAQTLPRQWPRQLEPVGDWIRCSGSFVAGARDLNPPGSPACCLQSRGLSPKRSEGASRPVPFQFLLVHIALPSAPGRPGDKGPPSRRRAGLARAPG